MLSVEGQGASDSSRSLRVESGTSKGGGNGGCRPNRAIEPSLVQRVLMPCSSHRAIRIAKSDRRRCHPFELKLTRSSRFLRCVCIDGALRCGSWCNPKRWDRHPDRRTAPFFAVDLQGATVQLSETLGQGQPQAGAFVSAGIAGVDLPEWLQRNLDLIFGHANTGIAHLEYEGAV